MKFLLDTHSFLWFIEDNPRLSSTGRALMEAADNQLFLSAASVWEMAIKISLSKLRLSQPFEVFIPEQLSRNRIELLDITVQHAAVVSGLPFHHRDPFDRLLIAQALTESLPIIGNDGAFDAYAVTRLW